MYDRSMKGKDYTNKKLLYANIAINMWEYDQK